jgi:hypothetical protein
MNRRIGIIVLAVVSMVIPGAVKAQNWSGIIDSKRGMDWSTAGIPGGLPDAKWPICTTIAAYSGGGTAITNALAACNASKPNGGVVALGSGTFNLSSGISFPSNTVGHLVLRGQGAGSTQLNFSGGATGCNGGSALICANSNDNTYPGQPANQQTLHNWTGGYGQGSTQLTLDSTSGIVAGKSLLILNQCDTGYSGSSCTSGSPADNGGYFVCAQAWTGAGSGCASPTEGPDGNTWRANAWQMEVVQVTGINGNTVTINQPIEHPNWASSQSPQAIVMQPVPQDGIENLSIDGSATVSAQVANGIYFYDSWQCWVSGVKITNVYAHSVGGLDMFHTVIQSNYFYGNPGGYNDSAGADIRWGANILFQNNICQQVKLCWFNDGPSVGDVVAYNYSVDQSLGSGSNDFMWPATENHSAGGDFELFEGNAFNKSEEDGDHGGHLNQTRFRNFLWGWESCANGQCGSNSAKSTALIAGATTYDSRYGHWIGNVLGTPGFTNTYMSNNANPWGVQMTWTLGAGNASEPADPLGASTVLLWANWDVATNGTRWCGNSSNSGWSSVCGGKSEVPTGAPSFPNAVPTLGDTGAGQGALPPSFYMANRPSWWPSAIPFPAIGPDVSGGNIGQCGGPLNTPGKFNGLAATSTSQCSGSPLNAAWGGHVNANPAMACYLSLKGVPDGTGGPLAFDAKNCYGASSASSGSGPQPPTGLIAVVH